MKILIRDARSRRMFRVDDVYVDEYQDILSVYSDRVYMALCRHAGRGQKSWPSIERLAKGMSRTTAIKALKELAAHNIIAITRERDERTRRQKNNVYTLLDVSVWKREPGTPDEPRAESTSRTDPGPSDDKSRVHEVDWKDAHKKDTQRRVAQRDASRPPVCAFDYCSGKPMRNRQMCARHEQMDATAFRDWLADSDQEHIRVVAKFLTELITYGHAPDLRTAAQWQLWLKPNLKVASEIVRTGFTDDQLARAVDGIVHARYITEYSLATVVKFALNSKKK